MMFDIIIFGSQVSFEVDSEQVPFTFIRLKLCFCETTGFRDQIMDDLKDGRKV